MKPRLILARPDKNVRAGPPSCEEGEILAVHGQGEVSIDTSTARNRNGGIRCTSRPIRIVYVGRVPRRGQACLHAMCLPDFFRNRLHMRMDQIVDRIRNVPEVPGKRDPVGDDIECIPPFTQVTDTTLGTDSPISLTESN